jgi:predicted esterase
MKHYFLLTLSLFFLIESTKSQTYYQLRDSAAKFREKKEYAAAFTLLSKGISLTENPYHNDLYDVAALASIIQMNDTALYYLNRLINEGEYEMILSDAKNDPDFKSLQANDKWWLVIGKASKRKTDEDIRKMSAIVSSVNYQDHLRFFSDSVLNQLLEKKYTGKELLKQLNHYNQFPPVKMKQKRGLLVFAAKINDSTHSFYEVQLPDNYNTSISYSVLLVLHGAVFMNSSFPDPRSTLKYGFFDTTGMNQFFSQYGYRSNTIVVYPHANSEFNWMFPDDGFPMILNIVKDLKRYFNIDDNKVFISGHSNGATGVVSYLLKSPNPFAGFYGFNSNPRVRTGGTFITNALNRSYFNVATNKDYYFPVSGHDTLAKLATSAGIDWQNHVYYGFPHWFPQFKESEPAFKLMFRDMNTRIRNPSRHNLNWECDDVKYGRCDWVSIEQLDTLAEKKNWQTEINFRATHWINNNDTSKVSDTVITAFNFPRLSGAVKAHYKNNRFYVETSRVKKISIFLNPEMIDFSIPVTVVINGRKVFNKKMNYDRDFMLHTFRENFDRKAIWVNYISLQL